MSVRGKQRARRPSASARRARSPPPGSNTGRVAWATRGDAAPTARAPTRTAGRGVAPAAKRRADASESERALPRRQLLTGSSSTGIDAEGRAGGKAEASTNGRDAATSAWQAAVSAGTRRAPRIGQCCSTCGRCLRRSPIGGVSSSERVPRVRRRGEAAPLGRAWLEWGSCLETRASGAPAVPPDPKVDDKQEPLILRGPRNAQGHLLPQI